MPRKDEVSPGVPDLALMSIANAENARHMPFEGTLDPSLPIGMWQCGVQVTGDGSGGVRILNVNLSQAGDQNDSLYSLEQVLDQSDSVTANDRQIFVANAHSLVNALVPLTMTISAAGVAGIDARQGWAGRDVGAWLPWFIGRPPPPALGLQLFIALEADNENLVAYRALLWGYRWGPRAFATPSGPVRPLGSVFGY